MTDILVTEDIHGRGMDELCARFDVVIEPGLWQSPAELLAMAADTRAIIVRNQTQVTAQLLASCSQLKVVGRAGVGLDNIDTRAATAAGVVVTYTPSDNAISVAELTLGLMLSVSRHIPAADSSTRAGEWRRQHFTGVELYGKTLGLVGLGRIGRLVAQRAKAFDMTIIAYDPYVKDGGDVEVTGLEDLLERSDYVSCHLPATDQTRGLFDFDRFAMMKPTGYFINTSRGEVVNENDLIRALKESRIAGAGLDVRSTEPPGDSELHGMDNVVITPHIAAFTDEAQLRVVDTVCKDVAAVLDGQPASYAYVD